MLLTNRQREELSKHYEPITPFMSLAIYDGLIKATRQLGSKLYTIELSYMSGDEALILLSQLSYMGDETFKLYCEIKKSSDI